MKAMFFFVLCLLASLLNGGLSFAGVMVFNDNFDTYSDSPAKHGWSSLGANVSVGDGYGYDGTRGVRVMYNMTGTEPYWFGFNFDNADTLDLYVRFRFKIVGVPTGGAKFLKIFGKTFDPQGYANSTFSIDQNSHLLSGITYGNGDGLQNDTQNRIRFDGMHTWDTDHDIVYKTKSNNVTPYNNGWHLYEARVKFNTNGRRDGVYEVAIDGVVIVSVHNVKNRNDLNSHKIASVQFANYCGATYSTPWELYIDDVYATNRSPALGLKVSSEGE